MLVKRKATLYISFCHEKFLKQCNCLLLFVYVLFFALCVYDCFVLCVYVCFVLFLFCSCFVFFNIFFGYHEFLFFKNILKKSLSSPIEFTVLSLFGSRKNEKVVRSESLTHIVTSKREVPEYLKYKLISNELTKTNVTLIDIFTCLITNINCKFTKLSQY